MNISSLLLFFDAAAPWLCTSIIIVRYSIVIVVVMCCFSVSDSVPTPAHMLARTVSPRNSWYTPNRTPPPTPPWR